MSRRAAIRRVGGVILAANLLLAVAKAAVWWQTGSLAVGSEAVNSLADTVYSLVVVAGLYLTTQPPDFEHPHGHERIEPFVSLVVAISILGAGVGVLWQAGLAVLGDGGPPQIGVAAVGVLAASAVMKYALYRFVRRVGEVYESPALIATALDNRNDILTAVAALVGVVGVRAGFPLLDPVAAIVVAIGIFYTGWEVIRDNINYLVGRAPPDDLRQEILAAALSHDAVEGAHDVVAHYVGPEVDVSLHIEVEGDRTLREAHAIETEVIESVRALPGIDDVFVHVDPKELGEWKADTDVDRLLDERLTRQDENE